MIRSVTNAFKTPVKATPMTNATASSIRFPLIRKSLNSFSTESMPTPVCRCPTPGILKPNLAGLEATSADTFRPC